MSGIPQVSQQAFIEKLQTGDEAWVKTLRSMAPDADGNGIRGDSEIDIRALAEAIDPAAPDKGEWPKMIDSREVKAYVDAALDGGVSAEGQDEIGDKVEALYSDIETLQTGITVVMGFETWARGQN